jgi:hypothetical protein
MCTRERSLVGRDIHHILYARFGVRTPDTPLIHLKNGILASSLPGNKNRVYIYNIAINK